MSAFQPLHTAVVSGRRAAVEVVAVGVTWTRGDGRHYRRR